MLGKAFKYTCWGAILLFFYHLALIKKYAKPESDAYLVSQPFLNAARNFDWFIYDMKILFTKPGMSKMLPDRINMPGIKYPKVLVLNLNGTLVH